MRRVTLLVLYLILQFHFYLYALIYVTCIRRKKKMEKKGAGCVEYQQMSTYFAGNLFPPLVYHVPDIFDVRAQHYRRPEL